MSKQVIRSSWEEAKKRIGNDRRGLLLKRLVGAGFRVKANGVVLQRNGDYLEAR